MTEPAALLFEQNLEWVAAIARNVHRRLPPSFELDDLAQEARIKLWDCVLKFNPGEGVPFRAFAYIYIRGAVLMKCRRRHWADNTSHELNLSEEEEEFNPRAVAQLPVAVHVDPLVEREREQAENRRHQCRHEWLLGELKALPPLDAYLVMQIYIEGTSLDDIARARQVERRALSYRLTCAVRQLKKAGQKIDVGLLTNRELETDGKPDHRAEHALVA